MALSTHRLWWSIVNSLEFTGHTCMYNAYKHAHEFHNGVRFNFSLFVVVIVHTNTHTHTYRNDLSHIYSTSFSCSPFSLIQPQFTNHNTKIAHPFVHTISKQTSKEQPKETTCLTTFIGSFSLSQTHTLSHSRSFLFYSFSSSAVFEFCPLLLFSLTQLIRYVYGPIWILLL